MADFDRFELTRRGLLKGFAALGAGAALSQLGGIDRVFGAPSHASRTPHPPRRPNGILGPGSRPYPDLPEGIDTLPQIEHIVVVMMENHSYDDHFGMLRRGDGFLLDRDGLPLDANPDGKGNLIRAFHMPSTCQLSAHPGQDWNTSHAAWDNGRNDGFASGFSGPVAMGYWDETDIPFYYGLANTFPVCDRWFCSVLAQTYPNRRFLMAGTAAGIVTTTNAGLTAPAPPNGTIFDRFQSHGISWRNYYSDLPSGAIILDTIQKYGGNFSTIDQFYADAQSGNLPAFSLVDPNFSTQSEENEQDIHDGELFSAFVIQSVLNSPAWPKTLLIWTFDEHGGYYDHVPPPPAIAPDDIPPGVDASGPLLPGGYDRYGFRVPAVIVSPYARKRHVSHRVHDHTSILKLVETKWNLGALTYRDANADNLLDSLDFRGRPAFLEPPSFPAPGIWPNGPTCTPGDPGGPIPPPDAVVSPVHHPPYRVGATRAINAA